MQNWHFRISGRVVIPDDGTNVEIHPENFVNLIRISDYQQDLVVHQVKDPVQQQPLVQVLKVNKIFTIKISVGLFDLRI